jgi:tRNA 5-methylaminomethyl-2-thiouridine biosynthesis bifunctional protein
MAPRGWRVTLVDRASGPGSAASGNPAGIIYPKIAPPHLSAWHFQQQGYLWLLQQMRGLTDAWRETGLLWLLSGNQAREGDKLAGHPWEPDLVHRVSADEASDLAGVTIETDCLHFPQAGFLHPDALYRHWLADARIETRWQTGIARLERQEDLWLAHTAQGETLTADAVILANALDARDFIADLPVYAVRGQISLFPETPALFGLRKVLSYGGYLTPAFSGRHCMGASFVPHDEDTGLRLEDQHHNLELLQRFFPALGAATPDIATWQARASLRTQSRDYLPLVGQVADRPGLYLSVGHGSKGFSQAPLAAEILAAEINGEPFPVPLRTLKSLQPGRFAAREARRNPKK